MTVPSASARRWSPPTGALGDLVATARERAASLAGDAAEWRARAGDAPPVRPFAPALRRESVAVIAEVKRASPSKGDIAPGLDAAVQAAAYVRGGAAAVSVLTEPTRFGGRPDDLTAVAREVPVPAIRKDFLVDPRQIMEARALGASAVLLIVRALAPDVLPRLLETAAAFGLGALVEVRDEAERDRALAAGATVIGVNNRNLETLVIDPATAPALVATFPADVVGVAESGMRTPSDAAAAVAAGADALLVGSAISAAADPAAAVGGFAALRRVPRAARGGAGATPGASAPVVG